MGGLRHDEIVPSYNDSFRTTVKWQKPLFTHSVVTHYIYKTTKKSEAKGRAIDFDTVFTTVSVIKHVLVDVIYPIEGYKPLAFISSIRNMFENPC